MAMKNKTLIFCSALLPCLLTSCTRAIVLQVFNNTGTELEVVSGDEARNETCYFIGTNKSQRVKIPSLLPSGKAMAFGFTI
jgi:hypothetical protein